MSNNTLYISPYQFEELLKLDPVKDQYTYYVKDFSDIRKGEVINKFSRRWIKYAGIEFVEMHDWPTGGELVDG